MENYIVIFLQSVIVLLSALYVYKVEQRIANADRKFRNEIVELKDKFVIAEGKHRNEIELMKEEIKSNLKSIHAIPEQTNEKFEDIKTKLQNTAVCRDEISEIKHNMTVLLKETYTRQDKALQELKKGEIDGMKEELKELQVQNTVRRDEIYKITRITVLLNETNTRHDKALQELNKDNRKTAFFVTMKDVHEDITTNTILKFTGVKTNIGDGYHSGTGKFTAPAAGLYEFNASFITNGAKWLELNLLKNGELVVRGHAHMSHGSTGTLNAILLLQKGDLVYLRHPRSVGSIYGLEYSMFSGHQL